MTAAIGDAAVQGPATATSVQPAPGRATCRDCGEPMPRRRGGAEGWCGPCIARAELWTWKRHPRAQERR